MKPSQFGNLFFLLIAHNPHSSAKHALLKRSGFAPTDVELLSDTTSTLYHAPSFDKQDFQPTPAECVDIQRDYPPLTVPDHSDEFSFDPAPPSPAPLSLPLTYAPGVAERLPQYQQQFDEIVASLQQSRRHYSYPSYLEKTFSGLLLPEPIALDLIKKIVEKIPRKDILKDIEHERVLDNLVQRTAFNVLSAIDFLTVVVPESNEQLIPGTAEIHKKLAEFTIYNPKDPTPAVVDRVGGSASHYSSLYLLYAQDTLGKYLKSFPYLSKLHGLLGPKNLFRNELEILLRSSKRHWGLPLQFECLEFSLKVESLLKAFSSLLNHEEHLRSAAQQGLRRPPFPQDSLERVTAFGETYLGILESHADFEKLIDRILASDVFQGLRLELMRPNDLAGYELALVEPVGVGRKYDYIRPGEFPSQAFGISDTMGTPFCLQEISNVAMQNMVLRTQTNSFALRLREGFLRDFTADGLDVLEANLLQAKKLGNGNTIAR